MSDVTQENAIAFYQEDADLRMKAQSELVHDTDVFTTGKLFLDNPCDCGFAFSGIRKHGNMPVLCITSAQQMVY